MQALISSWLNLANLIFKTENETIHSTNYHLWHLKFAKYFVREMKTFCRWGRWQKAEITVNREREKRELDFVQKSMSFWYFCVVSCNNNAIFVGFSLICLQSFGFPLNIMYLLCIYKNPIISSLFKIDTLNFNMYILTILTYFITVVRTIFPKKNCPGLGFGLGLALKLVLLGNFN